MPHRSSPKKPAENAAISDYRRQLRQRLIAAREALPGAEHAALSGTIERHLEALLDTLAFHTIGFCWPFRGEFDARALIARRIARGARAALPVIVAPRSPMQFREWNPGSEMVEERFGIHIPASGATLHPDLILMPLNAFDTAGYRLGYGGGYFDRTLAALHPRPLAVGVGFELARVDTVYPRRHDLPLDYIVTESGTFACRLVP